MVTGSNECTESWAVNINTVLVLGGTNANIIDRINGVRNPEFLKLVQNNDKVLRSHNNPIALDTTSRLPLYSFDGKLVYNNFYKEDVIAFDKYNADFKKNADRDAINFAIEEAFDKPYNKSIDSLTDSINNKVKSAVPTAYSVTTNINGFNQQGDIDWKSLIGNDLIKESFNCEKPL